MKNKRRVLFYDIENTPTVVTTWGLWEQNAIETLEEWYILSYAYQWEGEDKVHVVALPDFKGYSKDKKNDKALCESLHKLFCEADLTVAHNGDEHDKKKSNARFLYHGLTPPSPYKTIDTKKVAKQQFKFNSNSLNNLGTYLGLGNKIENSGIKLWRSCMEGDMKAWVTMKKYNKQDVVLLKKVYDKLTPWMNIFPRFNQDNKSECPKCQGKNTQHRGSWTYVSGKIEKLSCQDCGHYFKGEKIK